MIAKKTVTRHVGVACGVSRRVRLVGVVQISEELCFDEDGTRVSFLE